MTVSPLVVSFVAALFLVGCGDGGDNSDSGSNDMAQGEDEAFVSLCESTPDIDTWSQEPITKTGEHYSIRLMTISPDPWSVGDNDWQIEVTSKDGQVLEGVTLFVTPYMPDHGHGVSPPLYNGVAAEEGVYDIDTFNLIMPGFWEMTVSVRSETLPSEDFAFRICVES